MHMRRQRNREEPQPQHSHAAQHRQRHPQPVLLARHYPPTHTYTSAYKSAVSHITQVSSRLPVPNHHARTQQRSGATWTPPPPPPHHNKATHTTQSANQSKAPQHTPGLLLRRTRGKPWSSCEIESRGAARHRSAMLWRACRTVVCHGPAQYEDISCARQHSVARQPGTTTPHSLVEQDTPRQDNAIYMNRKNEGHSLMYTRCPPWTRYRTEQHSTPLLPLPTICSKEGTDNCPAVHCRSCTCMAHTPAHGTTSAHEGSTTTAASMCACTNTNMPQCWHAVCAPLHHATALGILHTKHTCMRSHKDDSATKNHYVTAAHLSLNKPYRTALQHAQRHAGVCCASNMQASAHGSGIHVPQLHHHPQTPLPPNWLSQADADVHVERPQARPVHPMTLTLVSPCTCTPVTAMSNPNAPCMHAAQTPTTLTGAAQTCHAHASLRTTVSLPRGQSDVLQLCSKQAHHITHKERGIL